ncbi:MAG: GNAT family N-acetyltransferase [Lysobacteraceae bacterium]
MTVPAPRIPLFKFRLATQADVDAIVALVESTYRGDASRAGWTTEADLLEGRRTGADEVATQIARADSRMLLAECVAAVSDIAATQQLDGFAGDELLACAQIAIEDGVGYFGMFSVQPHLQNCGIGSALLSEAERIARDEWNLPCMRMTVIDVRVDLIPYYLRRGYRQTGNKKPFPYGDARFGIPKRPDLRFEILEKIL